MTKHTLSVLVENKPGVLARIAALFSRRGFNIDSLAVGPTEHPDISRMTIVVNLEDLPLEQVTKQLNKLVNVLKIVELEDHGAVERELVLVKVRADASHAQPGARDRPAVPRQGRRRRPRCRHHRGHRRPRQARGHAAGARAVRDPGARAVRHGRDRPRLPLDHRPRPDAGAADLDPRSRLSCPRSLPSPLDTAHRPTRPQGEPRTMAELFYDDDADLSHHPGPQGRGPRLRQPGPRPRAVAARLRRRRPGRPARGLQSQAEGRGAGPARGDAVRGVRGGRPHHGPRARTRSSARSTRRPSSPT